MCKKLLLLLLLLPFQLLSAQTKLLTDLFGSVSFREVRQQFSLS